MLQRLFRGALVVVISHTTISSQEPSITWRGETTNLEALGAAVPNAVDTIRSWAPFANECGYRIVVAEDGYAVLILSGTYVRKHPKKEHRDVDIMLASMRKTSAIAQSFLPPPKPDGAPELLICSRTEHYPKLLAHLAALDPRLKELLTFLWVEPGAETTP